MHNIHPLNRMKLGTGKSPLSEAGGDFPNPLVFWVVFITLLYGIGKSGAHPWEIRGIPVGNPGHTLNLSPCR